MTHRQILDTYAGNFPTKLCYNFGIVYAPVDENFPSRRQVLAAVGIALLTGMLGFGLSYSLFIANRTHGLPSPVDRRAAEGGVPRYAQKGNPQRWAAPPSFLIVTGSGYRPERKEATAGLPKEVEELKKRLTMPAQVPANQPRKVARVDLPTSAYPEGGVGNPYRPVGKPTPLAEKPATPAPTLGRSFPPAGSRPPSGSLQNGWGAAQGSVVQLQGFGDQVCYGVLVDDKGTVITRAGPMIDGGLRTLVNGMHGSVLDVIGYEPEYELAVLRIAPAPRPAPLAPEAPSASEVLALAPGVGLPSNLQTAEVLESTPTVGEGTFRFQGAVYPGNTGSPLINSRGEVIGLVLGKPAAYPGQNYAIGVDTAVLWTVLQKANANQLSRYPGSGDTLSRSVRALMLSQLPSPGSWSAPSRANSRALPGESLGMYSIGMSREDLERAFGRGKVSSFPGGFNNVRVDQYPLEFTLLDDRVVAISTTDRFYATPKGVGVGMDTAAAHQDPSFADAVLGYGPGGRSQLVARGIGLNLGSGGNAESLMIVTEPAR